MGSGGTEPTLSGTRTHLADQARPGSDDRPWVPDLCAVINSILNRLGADQARLSDRFGQTSTATAGTLQWTIAEHWGLPAIHAEQFLFVPAAADLPATDGCTFGDIGVHSLLHLPIRDRGVLVGALDVGWSDRLEIWDDRDGPLVRNVARLMLLGQH